MQSFQRGLGLFILVVLLVSPTLLTAQDDEPIPVAGSGIVAPVFNAMTDASETTDQFSVTTTGTTQGFVSLCDGDAAITLATRPITVEEDTNCSENQVQYIELLVGYVIPAYIVNPAIDFTTCLSTDVITNLFAPTAATAVTDWSILSEEYPETPLSVFIPADDTIIYAMLDSVVLGEGIRADAVVGTNDSDTIRGVRETEGAIGIVNLSAAVAAGDSITILDMSGVSGAGCAAPSAENVENRLYEQSLQLYVYVNTGVLSFESVDTLLTFLASDDSTAVIEAEGVTAPTSATIETNREIIETGESGRQFTQSEVSYDIPFGIVGQVTAGGAGTAFTYLNSVGGRFTSTYPGVTITFNVEGQVAGFRRICNGELDIVIATTSLSAEQVDNCSANNITLEALPLGAQAVVLVSNAGDDFATCLTTDQIYTIWSSEATDTIENWNQVDESFPDLDMTLFAASSGDPFADMLFITREGPIITVRPDTEINGDPLYRAAATANVPGALTFMSWNGYQQVLDNEQANIRLVDVDAGAGCITPSEETIFNSTYPLIQSTNLILTQSAMARPDVQSYLWFLFSDENYTAYENSAFIGIAFEDLPAIREELLARYAAAEEAVAASQADAEATAEPGAETTTEPATEATASPDMTDEPSAEVTETAEMTSEPVAEETPAPDATDEAESE